MKPRHLSLVFLMLNSLVVFLNGTYEHGVAHMQGRRRTMEDAYTSIDPLSDERTSLFAIFDGHNGKDVARYAAQNIQQAVENSTAFSQDLTTALRNAFDYLDQNLAQGPLSNSAQNSGSTAVVTLIRDNQLHNAHVGDSRALLSRNGQAIALTNDHKPNRPDERERIEAAGGFVTTFGAPRVNYTLAVSRALGDHALRSAGVIATPEVTQVALTPHDEFLLLACDGVFEKDMNDQQAIECVHKSLAQYTGDPQAAQQAAQELIQEAYNRGSRDNISALVVLLNQHQNNPQDSVVAQPDELSNQASTALNTNADNITVESHNEQNQPILEPAIEPRPHSTQTLVRQIKNNKGLIVGVGVVVIGAGAYLLRKPIYNLYKKAVLNAKNAWQNCALKKLTESF